MSGSYMLATGTMVHGATASVERRQLAISLLGTHTDNQICEVTGYQLQAVQRMRQAAREMTYFNTEVKPLKTESSKDSSKLTGTWPCSLRKKDWHMCRHHDHCYLGKCCGVKKA